MKLRRIAAASALALASGLGGCADLRAIVGPTQETCSIVVSKEEGYKRICESGDFYRVSLLSRKEALSEAEQASHTHLVTALARGRVVSTYKVNPFAAGAARALDMGFASHD